MSRYWNTTTDTRASSIFHYYNSTAGTDMMVLGVSGDAGGVLQSYNTPNQISLAKMVIQANGFVGIGTTTPSYLLDVGNYSATSNISNAL
jgi:hypothetical protein